MRQESQNRQNATYRSRKSVQTTGASSLFAYGSKQSILPEGFNPARGIEKFREAARERFLTLAELERLGAAIDEAETTGVPWFVDEEKPTAKHTPKAERITRLSPFARAAIRLLLFT